MDGFMALSDEKCEPCSKSTPPLTEDEIQTYLPSLNSGWQVIDLHHIEREFAFKNFRDALDFTLKVGNLAEVEGHHPDIALSWGRVKITLWTHKINGVSKSDFVLAAKIDRLVD